MIKARIYKIDRLNTHNGPGFRTVIYFKGCPLHCTWCHNPEGISKEKEVWFFDNKCIGCGTCVQECPQQALDLSSHGISIDRDRCTGCQICTDVCPSTALEKIGIDYSLASIMKIIKQDTFLFESSGGGVTVTGGEPGMQPEFVSLLFQACRSEGIHTAFDTSGAIPDAALQSILPHTDLVFLDIKLMDEDQSIKYTGLKLSRLKRSLKIIQDFSKEHGFPELEIRTPLVPKVTDTDENLNKIGEFLAGLSSNKLNWELCMFNDLCEDKYNKMGREWTFKGQKHTQQHLKHFQELTHSFKNLNVNITGFIDNEQ